MDNKHRHETWNLMRLCNISQSENVWASRAIRRLKVFQKYWFYHILYSFLQHEQCCYKFIKRSKAGKIEHFSISDF